MPIGAFTQSFDLPLLLVIVFFVFFLALIYYLRQEDKREGYPLVSDRTARTGGRVEVVGFPGLPTPKTFIQPHGRPPVQVPRRDPPVPVPAPHAGNFRGMPVNDGIEPLGKNLGPGSYADRADEPDLSYDGEPVFEPLRTATAYAVMKGEPDPRGYTVLDLDKRVAGEVVDIWINKGEHSATFLEVMLAPELRDYRHAEDDPDTGIERDMAAEVVGVVVTDQIVDTPIGTVEVTDVDPIVVVHPVQGSDSDSSAHAGQGADRNDAPNIRGTILLPMDFAAVNQAARTVRTAAITARQFAGVPRRKADLVVTAREENQLRGYYGGGYLWATRARSEPMI